MPAKKLCVIPIALASAALLFTNFAVGQKYEILTGSTFGSGPSGGLVADAAGNLYGSTRMGGANGAGSVFELSPPTQAGGAWTEATIYSFDPDSRIDGLQPFGTLVFDKAGNLYGTTEYSSDAYGTVFQLSPPASAGASWTETVLYDFPLDQSRGALTESKLIFDGAGNLYGTAPAGGAGAGINGSGGGVIFRLSPPSTAGGVWTQTVLHSFGMSTTDGKNPGTGLLIHNGVFYGATENGGANGDGEIFQMARQNGEWVVTDIHDFSGADGTGPVGPPIMDHAGNLYGTADSGGIKNCDTSFGPGCGTVYELSPPSTAGGNWQLTTLYTFPGGADGGAPWASLIMDKAGNLYGTGTQGGGFKNNGAVFKLKAPASQGDAYINVVLHDFYPPNGDDGGDPAGEVLYLGGRLYGTTWGGGSGRAGAVFSVLP